MTVVEHPLRNWQSMAGETATARAINAVLTHDLVLRQSVADDECADYARMIVGWHADGADWRAEAIALLERQFGAQHARPRLPATLDRVARLLAGPPEAPA